MYYILFGGQQIGPFSIEQLKQMISSGEIKKETSVCPEGMYEWVDAGSLSELSDIWKTNETDENRTDTTEEKNNKIKKESNRKICDIRSWENIVGLIGAGSLLISLFLPYVSIQIFGTKVDAALINKPDGVIFLGLVVITLLAIYFNLRIGYMIISLFSFGLGILEYNMMMDNAKNGELDISALISKEPGFYLMFAAFIALLVSSIARMAKGKEKKEEKTVNAEDDIEQPERKNVSKKHIIIISTIVGSCCIGLIIYFAVFHLNAEQKIQVAQVEQSINDIGIVGEESGDKIRLAEGLYAGLTIKCRWHINNYSLLENARAEYDEVQSSKIENEISAIGTVTLTSRDAIMDARAGYEALEEQQKTMVDNISVLNDAESVYDRLCAEKVIDLIDGLGTIEWESGEKITIAQEAYDDLTDTQKQLVTNYGILEGAPETYCLVRVEHVESKIDAIGKVTEDREGFITSARAAYNELDPEEKELVENYGVLEQAEADIRKIWVYKCIAYINDIGEVGLDSGAAIFLARNTYDHLDQLGKNQITNYGVLLDAESSYNYITKVMSVGETDSGRIWDITLSKISITNKILPTRTNGYYWYKSAPDGQIFLDLVFTIKNTSQSSARAMDAFGDCIVVYDNISYTKSYTLYNPVGSSVSEIYSWDGVGALNSATVHLVVVMPKECQTDNKGLSIHLVINGNERIFPFK